LRLVSAAVTTRGFTTDDMRSLGRINATVKLAPQDEHVLAKASTEVAELTSRFPVPGITAAR
ncbi:MAG: glyA, partial [Chloroflexi bacterium]|nr:glyA [Chloroflexota bacterium]